MQSENVKDKNQRKKKGRTWVEAAKLVRLTRIYLMFFADFIYLPFLSRYFLNRNLWNLCLIFYNRLWYDEL